MMYDNLGKRAEDKIKEWLNHPELGQDFLRLPDQMTGYYGSSNICDFIYFQSPELFYIESKATYHSRFDFSMISEIQYRGLLSKSGISHVHGVIIVLFASVKRAFMIDISVIDMLCKSGKKSINIDKINSWDFKYAEIPTIENSRKSLLDYTGDFLTIFKTML